MNELHIVLKISERCNLSCTYCYFFVENDSYTNLPPLIKESVLLGLTNFIKQAVLDCGFRRVLIAFHGGEPLLMKKAAFRRMISFLNEEITGIVNMSYAVQTNGMLLDNEWFDIFNEYNVSVGISLDGPKEYNDLYRVDKKGRGSYDKIIHALNNLSSENLKKIACLSVINKDFKSPIIYEHLVKTLGFKSIDALLPDITHDSDITDIEQYGLFLCDLYDSWIEHDNVDISIRICRMIIDLLLGKEEHMIDTTYDIEDIVLISIRSDGVILYDDTLKEVINTGLYNICETSLKTYLASDEFQTVYKCTHLLSKKCEECVWKKICRGGRMINRYSKESGFNNPSILCDALQIFYAHITKSLLKNGVPKEQLMESLLFSC